MTILISSYFPPISYFSAIKHSTSVCIEQHEHYDRQTIRNRCYILSPNGIQPLTVPVCKTDEKDIKKIKIDYATPWHLKHAHAIRSAYGKTPFFNYYYEELISPIFKQHQYLFELNQDILQTCLKLLKIQKPIELTAEYKNNYANDLDYRHFLIKKYPSYLTHIYPSRQYIQAFADRFPFAEDLSILDLLFNTGFEAVSYL